MKPRFLLSIVLVVCCLLPARIAAQEMDTESPLEIAYSVDGISENTLTVAEAFLEPIQSELENAGLSAVFRQIPYLAAAPDAIAVLQFGSIFDGERIIVGTYAVSYTHLRAHET